MSERAKKTPETCAATAAAGARVAAIVGRPNVGKSALFNRLIGRRRAIVHEESGVTRDRLVDEVVWEGARFELMDTGGLHAPDAGAKVTDIFAAETRRQAEVAMADATVLLLVTDVQSGLHPADQAVADQLRRGGKPALLVANKADHEGLDAEADEFSRLGFPVFPVSAAHGRGVAALLAAVAERLPAPPAAEAGGVDAPLRVAVVGRPNAGKSSFINRLLGRERLIVSDVPGTTRESVEVSFRIGDGPAARRYVLVDTAGMRYQGKVKEAVEKFSLIRTRETIAEADVVALVLDAAEGPSRQDQRIARLIADAERGCLILVNKWDLAGRVTQKAYEEALRRELPFMDYAPVRFISAKTGAQVSGAIRLVDEIAAQVAAPLTTGLLNRVLRDAFARVGPPSIQGRRLRLYYAAQIRTRPQRIKLFVNDPKLVTPAYETYLVRELRRVFGLRGAPVRLIYARSERKERS